MGATTFSGPIKSGTVREGASQNTGHVVLAQTFATGDMTGVEVGNVDHDTGIILPKGSQIVDIVVDCTTAFTTGSATVSVGTASGGAQLMAGVAVTAGGRFRGTATAATQAAWTVSTTADVPIYIRTAVGTDTLGSGAHRVTIFYIQQ